jgi:hypothetical protein
MRRLIATALCALLLISLGGTAAAEDKLPIFADVTEAAGLAFKHSYGDDNLSNIVEGTGPGCAFFDYDGDGFLDVYLLNGAWRREVNDNMGRRYRGKLANKLYRNRGDGTFEDVTQKAKVGDAGYGMGASAADYDGDGDLDLYVLNYGKNVLYRNEGDGTFADVTEASGLGDPRWSLSAPWFDYDGDGDLDVYVVNYLEYDEGAFRDFYAAAGYPGPLSYKAQPDILYRNDGDGTFTDVTKEAGLWFPGGRGMSGIACDLDGNGRLDLYVTNDATPNTYWVNQGDGTFKNRAVRTGLAFGEGGQGASSMGPVAGDLDRDARPDVYIPDMGYGCLLMNRGRMFVDMTSPSNLAVICGQYTGWGGVLFDYDNDGFLDVYLATGNAHHEYTEEDVLVRNDGKGRFVDVARRSGPYFAEKHVGRGAAYADFDNDGDVDLLVMNLNGNAKLLRNDGGNRASWLTVAPRWKGTKAPVIGARVTVKVGERKLVHDVMPVTGYLSQSDPRAHFGLGTTSRVPSVEVRWPDGEVTRVKDVPVNQLLEVVRKRKRE